MNLRSLAAASAIATTALVASIGADPAISLYAVGFVPGNALDKSGLTGNICSLADAANCIDQKTLGGFGSALAYTGFDEVFLTVPDRGPFDGRTDIPYLDRFHFMHFGVTAPSGNATPGVITATLLDTRMMKAPGNEDLVGSSADFDHRFDPEGTAISKDGTFFVSDEYGPYINEFNRQGHLLRRIPVPAKFLIANPSGDVFPQDGSTSLELSPNLNTAGRQANRGMEGLAISPDGRYLFGLMQNALIQDHGLDGNTPPGRLGLNSRLLKIDLESGATAEYVYTLDAIGNGRGLNDLVALNDHQFLVIERDNRSQRPTPPDTPQQPNNKKIFKIDVTGATDVSGVESLPQNGGAALTAAGITPVAKTLFIDLLDPAFRVNASQTVRDVIAEKIEGLAFGPDLADGRHVLYVISDNDLFTGDAQTPERPTQIFAFAIDPSMLQFERQQFDGPLFPPGQVKKAIK